MQFIKPIPVSDLPFVLKDVHDGLRDADLGYFTFEKVDAILALCQQIQQTLVDWVGPYMSEWRSDDIRRIGGELSKNNSHLETIANELLGREKRPYEVVGGFWPFIAGVRRVWLHMDELGLTETYEGSE